jgi:NADPH2:quinone reductase
MKALLSKSPGGYDTLVLEAVADPTPQGGEVLIAVKACGVNYPDVLIIEDKYQAKPKRPFAPGGEIAGVVEAVGEGVTRLKVGDRVIGQLVWGGMAEKVAVAETHCLLPRLPLPCCNCESAGRPAGGQTRHTPRRGRNSALAATHRR